MPMTHASERPESVFIAAIASDIGRELAARYHAAGHAVAGTYRGGAPPALGLPRDVELIPCDVADEASIAEAARRYGAVAGGRWTTFVSAVGTLEPIGPFFHSDAGAWGRSVQVNAIGQLQLLHALRSQAAPGLKKVCFLVGGGINGPFTNYSAYCIGKIALVKMCELIDDEDPDVHAVAVGTGWVATKIHEQTLAAGARAGVNLGRTLAFQASGEPGTSHDDIFACIQWCFAQGREATGGRNVSVVHDAWRDGDLLRVPLLGDRARWKLRRRGG